MTWQVPPGFAIRSEHWPTPKRYVDVAGSHTFVLEGKPTVLAELAEQGFELPQVIMQYRSVSKLKSTYVDALPPLVNPRSGRMCSAYSCSALECGGRGRCRSPNESR